MAALGKWIDGIKADGRVSDAARISLESRLAAVSYWLPLAARQLDEDVERVHQLRVSTRRAIAALKLYRDWLPRRPARWLKKRLRRMRRAAGDARDLDVFAARLQREDGADADELRSIVVERRAAVQPEIEFVADACLANNCFQQKVGRLLERVKPRGEPAQHADAGFRDWAAKRLEAAADEFYRAAPDGTADSAALHRFRIAGKRLRYTMELLAPAFGPEFRQECYPVVEQLQERLGEINDCIRSRDYLRQWSRELASSERADAFRRWTTQEETRLQEAIDAYTAWWTVERAAMLRHGLGLPLAVEPAPRPAAVDHSWVG